MYLKLLLQFLSQAVQLVQTLTQVDVTVKLDEGLDEIGHAPLGFHFIATAAPQRRREDLTEQKGDIVTLRDSFKRCKSSVFPFQIKS